MSIEPLTAEILLQKATALLAGLPCWQATGEFGSYLTFHFGRPRICINEPCEALRYRRLAGVEGEYQLWLEMCDWTVFQDGAKLAHNESDRESIRCAAATLQGQKLLGFTIGVNPTGGEFVFDLGGKIAFRRYDPYDAEEELWHLSTYRDDTSTEIISLTALGRISAFFRKGDSYTQAEYPFDGGWIPVQPIANSGSLAEPEAALTSEPPSAS